MKGLASPFQFPFCLKLGSKSSNPLQGILGRSLGLPLFEWSCCYVKESLVALVKLIHSPSLNTTSSRWQINSTCDVISIAHGKYYIP